MATTPGWNPVIDELHVVSHQSHLFVITLKATRLSLFYRDSRFGSPVCGCTACELTRSSAFSSRPLGRHSAHGPATLSQSHAARHHRSLAAAQPRDYCSPQTPE